MEKTQTVVAPKPGETRDCLDPWKMSFVHADGSVTLCCWSRPVGNIKDAPFGEILMNEAAREMRRGLLTGRIPDDCVRCPARMLVPVIALGAQGELKGFSTPGVLSATAGGTLGALGAVCIIWAFKAGGSPLYVMPLVFAGAPVINVLYSMVQHPPKTAPSPMLYVGFLMAAVGGYLVLHFKPQS